MTFTFNDTLLSSSASRSYHASNSNQHRHSNENCLVMIQYMDGERACTTEPEEKSALSVETLWLLLDRG